MSDAKMIYISVRCAFLAKFVFATRTSGLNFRTLRDMDVQLIPKMKRQNQCTNCTIQTFKSRDKNVVLLTLYSLKTIVWK